LEGFDVGNGREEFKQELTPFAARVEEKRTPAILVDVTRFRHRPDPEFMP